MLALFFNFVCRSFCSTALIHPIFTLLLFHNTVDKKTSTRQIWLVDFGKELKAKAVRLRLQLTMPLISCVLHLIITEPTGPKKIFLGSLAVEFSILMIVFYFPPRMFTRQFWRVDLKPTRQNPKSPAIGGLAGVISCPVYEAVFHL